jgi:hypothetical protein
MYLWIIVIYNCSSISERKFSPNVVVKLKEVVQTAHRYSRIICHLLMGIVLKIEMVSSLNCTSLLKDIGMSPLLCMHLNMALLPLQTDSSEQTTKFLYMYFHSIWNFSVKRLNFSCRPFHEHNFIILLFGCASTKKLSTLKNFYRLPKTYVVGGGISHFEGKYGNESSVPLRSSN